MIRRMVALFALASLAGLGCVAGEEDRPPPAQGPAPTGGISGIGVGRGAPSRPSPAAQGGGEPQSEAPAEPGGRAGLDAGSTTGAGGELTSIGPAAPTTGFGGGSGVGTGRGGGGGIPGATGAGAAGGGNGTGNVPYAPAGGLPGVGGTDIGTGRNTGGGIPGAAGLGASGTGSPADRRMNGASSTNPNAGLGATEARRPAPGGIVVDIE